MTELRFHRGVYAGPAVDEAAKLFANHAELALAEEAEHWVVKVTAPSAVRERKVAGELANYALGLTIRSRGNDKKGEQPAAGGATP